MEAGAKIAAAEDNEVNHGVGEKEVMVARKNSNKHLNQKLLQQLTRMLPTRMKIQMQVILPKQNKLVQAKIHQKTTIRDHSS
jgi:hypothetical protein